MPARQDIGGRGAVLISERDITRRVKTYSSTATIAAEDSTGLQPPGDAMEFLQGLEGGAASIGGMLPVRKELVAAELQVALGNDREAQGYFAAPWGTTPGYFGEFFQIHQSRFNTTANTPNITSFGADFVATGGIKRGTVLYSPRGSDTAVLNAIFDLILDDAETAGSFTFPATVTGAGGTVTVTPGDSEATIKAAIEALAGYDTVTVDGSSTGLYGADVAAASTATASSTSGGDVPANAIDGNTATRWTPNAGVPAWIKFQLAAPSKIGKLRMYLADTAGVISAFTLQGSNTGAFTGEQVTLKSVTGFSYTAGAWHEWVIDTPATYAYYRVNATAVASGQVAINEVQLLPVTPASGSYRIEVTAPGAREIAVPTTATAGYSAELAQAGFPDLENLNIVDATGDGDDVDLGAGTNDGGYLYLAIPYASVDCEATIRVVTAVDDGGDPDTYSELHEFDVVTEAGYQFVTIPRGTDIEQWVRVEVTDLTGELAIVVGIALNPPVA